MCVIEDLGLYIGNECLNGVRLFCVFDGHQGYHCAEFLKTYIAYLFLDSNEKIDENIIKGSLMELDNEYLAKCSFEGSTSGSTALVVLLNKNTLYCSWLGDCEAHLISKDFSLSTPLVKPHKLSDESVISKSIFY